MTNKELNTWLEWTVDLVRSKDLCPGPMPSEWNGKKIDSATLMTRNEFMTMCDKPHDHNVCGHYKNEVLGLKLPDPAMVEIAGVDAKTISAEDADHYKRVVSSTDHPSVVRLKRDLHNYVDAIELRDGGKLHIPSKLLKLSTFIKEYFNVKE